MGGGVPTVRETWSGKASPNAKHIIIGVDSYYDFTFVIYLKISGCTFGWILKY